MVKRAYQRYFFENGLNPTVFKSLNKMENEVVSITAGLLHAPESAVGTMTSGGTESIICAVKAAKKYALSKNKNITAPNMVVPETIHPAFYKAADYLDIEVRAVKGLGESLIADIEGIKSSIDHNTVLVAASAPAYPHGIIDPIEAIAALAQERGIWMHVDACVGGYILPFLEQIGEPIPAFDFRIAGVSSISLDLHKYGYSAKGSSVILYRDSELRKNQFYVHTTWPGGLYVSPSISGTRPGGAIAASWAILHYLGLSGYQDYARQTQHAARRIQQAINATNELKVVGDPLLTVFSFTSTGAIDIYRLGDELSALGWHLDRQLMPASLHLTVTYGNVAFVDDFIRDLGIALAKLKATSINNISETLIQAASQKAARILPESWIKKLASNSIQKIPTQTEGSSKTAALYGLVGELSGTGTLGEMLLELLDVMNKYDQKGSPPSQE